MAIVNVILGSAMHNNVIRVGSGKIVIFAPHTMQLVLYWLARTIRNEIMLRNLHPIMALNKIGLQSVKT